MSHSNALLTSFHDRSLIARTVQRSVSVLVLSMLLSLLGLAGQKINSSPAKSPAVSKQNHGVVKLQSSAKSHASLGHVQSKKSEHYPKLNATPTNTSALKLVHNSRAAQASKHVVVPLTKDEIKNHLREQALKHQTKQNPAKSIASSVAQKGPALKTTKSLHPERHDGYQEKKSAGLSKGRQVLSKGSGNKTVSSDISHFAIIRNSKMASAGYGGMRDYGYGAITLTGVTGTVTKAYLYWHGPTNTTNPMANANVYFAGTLITGENIGFSNDNCWQYLNSQAYRADVTSLVTGDTTYALAGFLQNDANINGVSLIVFYDDGVSSTNRDFVIFDGNDSNISNMYDLDGWNVSLPGITYDSGSVGITLHVSDGQTWIDDNLYLNGNIVASGPSVFDGNTVPNGPSAEYLNGGLWDIRTFDITSYLTPGVNGLSLTTGDVSDCLSLVVAVIDLPAGTAPSQFGIAKIEGMKFSDDNDNGVKETLEAGLGGWTVELHSDSVTLIKSTLTNPLGQYTFADLLPGTYIVSEVNQPGWTQTYPGNSGKYTVTIDSNEIVNGKDFGNYASPSSISGMKFNDLNRNGVKDSLEPGIQGWTIWISGPDLYQEAMTDSFGNYSFTNLSVGSYSIWEESLYGWVQTYPGNYWSVEIDTPGTAITGKDFGNCNPPPGEISGVKFNDLDGNGVRDSLEPGIAGWMIFLYHYSNGQVDTAITDRSGAYAFTNLVADDYSIYEDHPANWAQMYPYEGSYYKYIMGDTLTNIDFGNYQVSPSAIYGMKFNDLNGNGMKDTDEPGLAGWTISLYQNATGQTVTTVTDTFGQYSFTNLPYGWYQVWENQQDGWTQMYPPNGYYYVQMFGDTLSDADFGNMVLPQLSVDRWCMNFGTAKLNTPAALPLTVCNNGDSPLTVSSLSTEGSSAFSVLSDSVITVDPYSSTVIWVQFHPEEYGDFNGTLDIYADQSYSYVSLHGQGELPASGTGQQIFSGLVKVRGMVAPQHTVVGAYRTTGDLIKATVVQVAPENIVNGINYALSILVGQAGVDSGETIEFKVWTSDCEWMPERYCPPTAVFQPAFPPPEGYTRHDIDGDWEKSLTLSLLPGFNAVSWNLKPSDTQISTVFADPLSKGNVKIILSYLNDGNENEGFDFYIPELGEYNPLLSTDFRKGYFVKMNDNVSPDTMSVTGLPVCIGDPIGLSSGYNFVSFLEEGTDYVNRALSSLASGNLELALKYYNDGEGNEAFLFYPGGDFSMMNPGEGYFVKVTDADVLTYPSSVTTKASAAQANVSGTRPRHALGVDATIPRAVFAYGLHVTMNGKPVPAGTEIKAVDKDGVVCGSAKFRADGVFALPIYADNPSTAKDEGASQDELVSIYIGSKLVSQRVKWTKFGDTPRLDGDMNVTGVTLGSQLPKDYALRQNYPNPFNPTTSIGYEIPKASDVTLKIYNVLGAEVRTLVAGSQDAGYYQITWDGRNDAGVSVASGIYTYRIVANSSSKTFVQTHKMILMK